MKYTLTSAVDSSLDWHYEEGYGIGPSEWPTLPGSHLCGHSQQSPIQINPSDFVFNTQCNTPLNWNIDNTTYNFTVSHRGEDGHTILFENNLLSSNININKNYILDSFHFHWGNDSSSGSEHIFTNITTTLEIHFVHYAINYTSAINAIKSWHNITSLQTNNMNTLNVIGILFEEDDTNYNMKADDIIYKIANDYGMDNIWRNATGYTYLSFAITDLFDIQNLINNYYFYDGSLTTPPCTPSVRWYLGQIPIKIRSTTMNLFRTKTKLWNNEHIDADRNYRPIQNNPNCIYTCTDNNELKYCPDIIDQLFPDTFWHYEDNLSNGPSDWKNINGGKLCSHPQQSPILIDPNDFIHTDICATPLNWHVDNTIYNWTVTHKGEGGHTLRIYNSDAKSNVYLDNAFQYDGNRQHDKYKLYSLHFHWGPSNKNGSEHVYKGVTTTFEVHFVHYSSNYDTIGAAITDWKRLSELIDIENVSIDMHTLGVVGFLFQEVEDNELYNVAADNVLLQFAQDTQMDMLWQNATGKAYLSFAINDLVDPNDFMEHYYHYEGSLTTPPCTPAVRWHLAQNTIKIRKSTMDLFRIETIKWATATGHVDADRNFRAIQSNTKCIYTCSTDAWCPGIDYPDWHYEDSLQDGPSNWKNIPGGELCGHKQQSPILIDPNKFITDNSECNTPLNWHVDNTIYNWTITHKGEGGHTLNIYSDDAKHDVYLDNAFQYDGNNQHSKYKLYSFHFHWGNDNNGGSEHIYRGITTTFEVHFVHYSSDYNSIGEALTDWSILNERSNIATNDMHTLGVVGFLFEEVNDNELYNEAADNILLQFAQDTQMDMLWHNATGEAYLSFAITDFVNPNDFMEHYYHYEGSLTTPPCTPAVRWHLAQNTIKVRKSTMDLFRTETRAWSVSTGYVDADRNFRPIQSNSNCVKSCDAEYCVEDDEIIYPEWHYEDILPDGPSNWDKINALCGHKQQSPILIDPNKFTNFENDCATPLNWHVDNTIYNWSVTHKGENGHTLNVFNSDAKHDIYLDNSFQFDNNNNQHSKYKLYSFHFHWGNNNQSGSEHIFKNITTTLEIHFVHYSNDFLSVADAVQGWNDLSDNNNKKDMHTLGVIGFLFQEVDDNNIDEINIKSDEIIQEFANNYDMKQVWNNASGMAHISFSITDLVNVNDFENNYYHYWGSLTTPPCTPAVSWHLAQNTIKIKKSTMELFRIKTQLWQTAAGHVNADTNYRPIQNNPSCISVCSSNENMKYCPSVVIEQEEENKSGDKLLPLWIVLSIMCGLLIIGIPIYYFWYVNKKHPHPDYEKAKSKSVTMNVNYHGRIPSKTSTRSRYDSSYKNESVVSEAEMQPIHNNVDNHDML